MNIETYSKPCELLKQPVLHKLPDEGERAGMQFPLSFKNTSVIVVRRVSSFNIKRKKDRRRRLEQEFRWLLFSYHLLRSKQRHDDGLSLINHVALELTPAQFAEHSV